MVGYLDVPDLPAEIQVPVHRRLPEESVSAALVFGTGIHAAVEQHFQAILSGEEKSDIAAQLYGAFFQRPGYSAPRCTFRPAVT